MKQAVVLSGGGAYAAYEIGVLAALFRGESPTTNFQPIDPEIFCGTSAGSFNASILVSRPDLAPADAVEYLASVWYDYMAEGKHRCGSGIYRVRGDMTRLLNDRCNPDLEAERLVRDSEFLAADFGARAGRLLTENSRLASRLAQLFNISSFVDPEPYRHALEAVLRPPWIRASYRALRIAVTDWKLGKVTIFANEDMIDGHAVNIVMASSAIPGFFPPVELGGNVYVDGGVLQNTPLKPAIDACADEIHIIYLDPDPALMPIDRLASTIGTFDRMLLTQRAAVINHDCELARRINQGIKALAEARAGRLRGALRSDLEFAAQSLLHAQEQPGDRHRAVTIHRYHPREDLGGITGILNTHPKRIAGLIARGYYDTLNHDCGEQECVLADGSPAPFRFPANAEARAMRTLRALGAT